MGRRATRFQPGWQFAAIRAPGEPIKFSTRHHRPLARKPNTQSSGWRTGRPGADTSLAPVGQSGLLQANAGRSARLAVRNRRRNRQSPNRPSDARAPDVSGAQRRNRLRATRRYRPSAQTRPWSKRSDAAARSVVSALYRICGARKRRKPATLTPRPWT